MVTRLQAGQLRNGEFITYGANDFSPPEHPDQLWCQFSTSSMGTRCPFPRSGWGKKLIPLIHQC